MSKDATTLTLVGITLGLSYGGGLLINEARKGHIKAKDICAAILLLSLLHSIIEDTLLILLLGADLSAILWARLVFTMIVISLATRLMRAMGESQCQKYIYQYHPI